MRAHMGQLNSTRCNRTNQDLPDAQDRVSEFNAMVPLPAHAPKVLQAAVADVLPGSRVSVEGERVKIRTPHGVQEEFLLDLLLSADLGTFTPVDRAIYVTLEGISAIHMGWETGAPPMPGEGVEAEEVLAMEEIPVSQITSFFLGAESRAQTLQLQRDIATDEDEPLTAAIPGLALSEMWRAIGYAEDGLRVISAFVVLVGILGMLVSIYTSLEARRREMAILRALGAGPSKIVALLVLEAGMLALVGALLGVAFVYAGLALAQPWIEGRFGLLIPIRPLDTVQLTYLGAVVVLGVIAGLVPAVKAYRTALHDGLSVRV